MEKKPLLRESRSGEEAVFFEIIKSLPDYFFIEETIADLKADLQKQGTKTIVAASNGEVGGFLIYRAAGEAAEILWMAVRPGFQDRGAGTLLMEEFLRRMRAAAVKTVELSTVASTTNFPPYEGTRRFYERFGFKEIRIDKNHYAPGYDRGVMRKEF